MRFEIIVKLARLGRRPAPGRAAKDTDHPDLPVLPEGQHIAGSDTVARLGCFHAVDPQPPLCDDRRRKAAGLEKPRVP